MKDPWFYDFEKFADGIIRNIAAAAGAELGFIYDNVPGAVSGWVYSGQAYDYTHPSREVRKGYGNVTGSNPNPNPNPNPKRKRSYESGFNPKRIKVAKNWSDIFTQ